MKKLQTNNIEKEIYLITTYEMLQGVCFKTWQKSGFTIDEVIIKGNSLMPKTGRLPHSYSLSFEKQGIEHCDDGLLPYYANVKQDRRKNQQVFKNCQLMMKTKGGYKYFKNLDNNEELLIAINSHFYEPKNN